MEWWGRKCNVRILQRYTIQISEDHGGLPGGRDIWIETWKTRRKWRRVFQLEGKVWIKIRNFMPVWGGLWWIGMEPEGGRGRAGEDKRCSWKERLVEKLETESWRLVSGFPAMAALLETYQILTQGQVHTPVHPAKFAGRPQPSLRTFSTLEALYKYNEITLCF